MTKDEIKIALLVYRNPNGTIYQDTDKTLEADLWIKVSEEQ